MEDGCTPPALDAVLVQRYKFPTVDYSIHIGLCRYE
jgi:hypothetical protein